MFNVIVRSRHGQILMITIKTVEMRCLMHQARVVCSIEFNIKHELVSTDV